MANWSSTVKIIELAGVTPFDQREIAINNELAVLNNTSKVRNVTSSYNVALDLYEYIIYYTLVTA